MNILKDSLLKRGISFFFMLASLVFGLIAMILYLTTGTSIFTPKLSEKVIALYLIFVAGITVTAVIEVKLAKYAVYLLGLTAWLSHFTSQIEYIANIAVAIDGSTISPTFVMTIVFGALAWISVLVSAIMQKKWLGSSNKTEQAV